MEEKRCPRSIVMEQRYADAGLAYSPDGYKMFIPICNKAMPDRCMEEVWKVLEVFRRVYAEACGMPPESMYVDGNLLARLDRGCPAGQKFELRVVIVTEDACGVESQDYVIEIPILPGDLLFAEVRQCFADAFIAMLGCGGTDRGQTSRKKAMDKEAFWNVIEEANRCVEDGGQGTVLEAAQKKLMEYSAADIARWHEIKGVYMKLADRKDLWEACAAAGAHCTDDGFMDFRSWLIAQGKDVYMKAVQEPDSLAEVEVPREGTDFEDYGYVAMAAYGQKKEIEEKGLASILKDYWAWIGREGQIGAEAYLRTLEDKNDIYQEIDAHPLGSEEKEEILSEAWLEPDISRCGNREMLPGTAPRLCWRQGLDR